jgi:diadenylate cyclase
MSFLIPHFNDLIDIIIVAFIIYQSLMIIKRSGSYQILYGLLFVFTIYLVAVVFHLEMVSGMLRALKSYWVLALIILFQPELRALLARLNISEEFFRGGKRLDTNSYFAPLIDAISAMSFRHTGALIVIENRRKLNEYIHAGEAVDSLLSLRLILSIFNPKSVLHDGAIVIRGGRIIAAKVVLPLSKNVDYTHSLGTRHLAAIGVTELSDATAIVVSEQTGKISVARQGVIQLDIAFEELMQILFDASK